MKILKSILFTLLLGGFISSCSNEDSKTVLAEIQDPATAKLKVIYASSYVIRDSIQIKINDERVSNTFLGNSTTNLPTPYPGGGLNTGGDNRPIYLNVNPGNTKLFVSVPKKFSTVDSIIRFSGYVNLESGKHYSAFITDTLQNGNVVLTEDNMAPIDTGVSRFKFVNLMPNVAALDVYFGALLVAPAVPYKGVSPEFTLPRDSTGQWRIRAAGALPTSTPIAVYPAGATGAQTIPNQRGMTVFAKGYSGGTVARSPIISLLYTK